MKRFFVCAFAVTACFSAFSNAMAASEKPLPSLTVTSSSIVTIPVEGVEQRPIPEKFAYCRPDGSGKTKKGINISPEISWSGAPKGTKSFAVVVVDPDVPAKFYDANKDGKIIAGDFPRRNFYHWVAVGIPANIFSIPEGKGKNFTDGVTIINDFAGGKSADEAKEFYGYDGPCPPWNDERIHHYHFIVYALDIAVFDDISKYMANSSELLVKEKITQHAIAKGEFIGTYSNKK